LPGAYDPPGVPALGAAAGSDGAAPPSEDGPSAPAMTLVAVHERGMRAIDPPLSPAELV